MNTNSSDNTDLEESADKDSKETESDETSGNDLEEELDESLILTANEAINAAYDPQPTTLEEVQAAIDTYKDTGIKPRWENEVSADIIPAGYRCDYVEGENGDLLYWTLFPAIQLFSTDAARIGGTTYPTLVAAIAAANDDDTIVILDDIDIDTTITIDKKITIQSDGGYTCTVKQTDSIRHFDIPAGYSLTLQNIVLDGTDTGGGIQVTSGTLTLRAGAVIQNCYSSVNGGAIGASSSNVTIGSGAALLNNTAHYTDGGGIYITGGQTLTVESGAVISGNHADDSGDGILASNTDVVIKGAISDNSASFSGGIYYGGTVNALTLDEASVMDNSAKVQYGGIYCSTGTTINISNSKIINNTSPDKGGIILYNVNSTTITGSEISDNTAFNSLGGGLYIFTSIYDHSDIIISGSSISRNKASNGAGLYVEGDNINLTLDDCDITSNQASVYGGGLFISDKAVVNIKNSTISENKAVNAGGIYITDISNVAITSSDITNNTASHYGGGVYVSAEDTGTDKDALNAASNITASKASLGDDVNIYFYPAGSSSQRYKYLRGYKDGSVFLELLDGQDEEIYYLIALDMTTDKECVAFCVDLHTPTKNNTIYETKLYGLTEEQLAKIAIAAETAVGNHTPNELADNLELRQRAYVAQYIIWNITEGCYDSAQKDTLVNRIKAAFGATAADCAEEIINEILF